MSLGQYARAAWWNWNVMARTLAGNFTTDYIGGSWSNPSQDRTSRAEAVALSRAGSAAGNAVLALAKERLAAMPAFAERRPDLGVEAVEVEQDGYEAVHGDEAGAEEIVELLDVLGGKVNAANVEDFAGQLSMDLLEGTKLILIIKLMKLKTLVGQ